ncbi:unnamed protein product [Microthlaspi erraticum]|uniref:Uncharacterized protein n=1 Tax=Microthlaspi erraticum TaxID=1685480 RepID=A0A6D2KYI5_9BRAS|nr:unnamed protein product [Microthlaspi erraticum]
MLIEPKTHKSTPCRLHAVREELGQLHVLEHQLHILKDPSLSWCHHVGTWSPQSPWRREHCSALGTWGAHPPLALPQPLPLAHLGSPLGHLHQPIGSPLLLPHHSQFPHSFLHLESHFPPLEQGSLQSQTPLAHSHYYRVIPLLGSPFFPQSLTLRLSSSE